MKKELTIDQKGKLITNYMLTLQDPLITILRQIYFAIDIEFSKENRVFGQYLALATYNTLNNKFKVHIGQDILNTFNMNELLFVVYHELSHIILGHCHPDFELNAPKINKILANIVLDHFINSYIIESNSKIKKIFSIPDKSSKYPAIYLTNYKNTKLTPTQLYSEIVKISHMIESQKVKGLSYVILNYRAVPLTSKEKIKISKEFDIIENNILNDIDFNYDDVIEKLSDVQKIIHLPDYESQSGDSMSDIDKGVMDAVVQKIKANVQNALKNIGNQSEKIFEIINDATKTNINPYDALKDVIFKYIPIVSDDYCWRQINYPLYNNGIIRPVSDIEDSPKLTVLLLYIDSSGSITQEDLQKAIDVLNKVRGFFEQVHLKFHDTHVSDEFQIFEEHDEIKDVVVTKRGGTSHVDVFNDINKYLKDDEYQISLCILFTDGYSDFETLKNHEILKQVPIKVVLTGSDYKLIPKEIDSSPIVLKAVE